MEKRWTPRPGEQYWFIKTHPTEQTFIVMSTWKLADDHPQDWDRIRRKQNNMFKTKEQAERVLRGLLSYLEGEGSE